jgi:hypothetical protein
VNCTRCGQPAVGACAGCGRFYCERHGGATIRGGTCIGCYDSGRPSRIIAGLAEAGLGGFCLYLGSTRAEGFILLALPCFALSIWGFWSAFRAFPGTGSPGTA